MGAAAAAAAVVVAVQSLHAIEKVLSSIQHMESLRADMIWSYAVYPSFLIEPLISRFLLNASPSKLIPMLSVVPEGYRCIDLLQSDAAIYLYMYFSLNGVVKA